MIAGNTARDIARLFRHFFAAYPVRSTLMLLAITAAALAEGVGIAALLPMIGLVIEAEGAGGALTRHVEQVFAFAGQDVSLGGLLVLIVAAMALKALLMLLAMTQVGYSAAHVAMNLRLAFMRAILRARWLHFIDRRTGDLASAVSIEPTRTAEAYVAACQVLSGAIQILIYLAVCLAISWEISLLALAAGAFGMIALNRLVIVSRRAGQNQTDLQKSFMSRLLQGLDGMKPLKAMGREGSMRPLFDGDVKGLNRAQRTMVISKEALKESYELIRAFAVAGGLYLFVAVWDQPVDGLLVLALLFVRIMQKMSRAHDSYQIAATNQPAFDFLQSTIAAAEEAEEPRLGSAAPRLASAISLRDVSFAYSRENVLERVSMTLPAGAFIAVVGSSGAGKTTVADLIIGLLRPQQGEVWIDDVPLGEIDAAAWARHDRLRAARNLPLPRHGDGQRDAGRARHLPGRRGDSAAPRRGLGIRYRAAGRDGHGGRRTRRKAFRRSAAAHRHRAGSGPRPCPAHPGRGHHRARPGDGGRHRGHGQAPDRQAHGTFDLAPAGDAAGGDGGLQPERRHCDIGTR